jgi:hypothetical protein
VKRTPLNDRIWPIDDGPHPLTACHKPDAQGAAPKVSFAVLRSQVARPDIGQERKKEQEEATTQLRC